MLMCFCVCFFSLYPCRVHRSRDNLSNSPSWKIVTGLRRSSAFCSPSTTGKPFSILGFFCVYFSPCVCFTFACLIYPGGWKGTRRHCVISKSRVHGDNLSLFGFTATHSRVE